MLRVGLVLLVLRVRGDDDDDDDEIDNRSSCPFAFDLVSSTSFFLSLACLLITGTFSYWEFRT